MSSNLEIAAEPAQLPATKESETDAALTKIESIHLLSPLQEALLFGSLAAADQVDYCGQLCCTLSGPLDVQLFTSAWRMVIARHALLRTSFAWKRLEKPRQVVHKSAPVTLGEHDWRTLSAESQSELRVPLMRTERRQGFLLSEAPLIRLHLCQTGQDRCEFVWTYSRLILDSWSAAIILDEAFALYDSLCMGQTLHLEPANQFKDYLSWLKQQDTAQADAHWRSIIESFDSPTRLLASRAGSSASPHERLSALQRLELPEETTAQLKSFADHNGASLQTLLECAWGLLLSRYSREVEVIFGVTVSGRSGALEGIASTPGPFINTIPMCVRISSASTISAWLKEHHARRVEGAGIEFAAPMRVHDWCAARGGLPLFESAISLEDDQRRGSLPVSSTIAVSNFKSLEAQGSLLVLKATQGDCLTLELQYDPRRIDEEGARRLLTHFQRLAVSMTVQPDMPPSLLSLLGEGERSQILVDWNSTSTDYPSDKTLAQLFEAQAESAPGAIAAVFDGKPINYGELNRKANQLAGFLRELGVGPEVLVGVCVDRSVEMVIGVLGVVKAGGAYVPLDVTYPKERIAFILEETQAPVVLTQRGLENRLAGTSSKLVYLDEDCAEIASQSDCNPINLATPETLAYVIYTSGSTGRPKGVCVPHKAISRLVLNTNYVDLTASDAIAQASNFSFDAATFEIWGALLNGARLVGISKEAALSLPEMTAQLNENGINTIFLTSALFNQLAAIDPTAFASLKNLLVGGDALDPRWIREVLEKGRPQRLVNGYGPTETTTFAVCHLIEQVSGNARSVPIGRPIGNTQAYVLDGNFEPAGVGVPGELFIGGDGVARSYLKEPSLTAERFIPDPFSTLTGARLYRTGDLASYLSNGLIDCLGRIDNQIKIRGFRIEPGEIEVVLASFQGLREALVIPREDANGDRRLVAYIVPEADSGLTVKGLRSYLKERLPEYMIPSAIVILGELPLTANGKVDRNALPLPEHSRQEACEEWVAPRTPVEEVVAVIWADLLGAEDLSVNDNFFELGGHSLLATLVITRIQKAFQVDVRVRSLFEFPTVAGLAEVIEEEMRAGRGLQMPRLERVPRDQELPVSFAQQRLWVIHQLDPRSAAYNLSFPRRLNGHLNLAALQRTLDEIVRRHEVLRTTFTTVEGRLVQIIAPPAPFPMTMVDLRELPEAERPFETERLTTEEDRRLFDLSRGPLLRVKFLRLRDDDHLALVTMHHIVGDEWSINIFFQELAILYESFCKGAESPLGDLPIQYADFAYWQRQWLQGEVLDTQLSYWKQQLLGAPPVLELPTDFTRPSIQTFRGATLSISLAQRLSEGLRELSRRSGTTLFMTMAAAFNALLYRYTGQREIVVGTPIANRNRLEVEGLIGFFINTVVLRTSISDDPSFEELLARVREQALGAYVHQELPFEKLVEEMQPERTLSYTPLFQAMFVLRHDSSPELELGGLESTPLNMEVGTAKFDLTMAVINSPQCIGVSLEYNTDLFEAHTIEQMLFHFELLIEAIIADPSQRISGLEMLSSQERDQLVLGWNNTQAEYPRNKCVHELFEQQAAQTPEGIALTFGAQKISYKDLNRRANQLANYLREMGVGPEVLVGVCLERSVDMVTALFGVLKAGGAYVPLDPTHPKERLGFILDETEAQVVLTHDHLADEFDGRQIKTVCLDRDYFSILEQREDNPVSGVDSANLAYVIYTSGSTGAPKGVQISHGSVANFLASMSKTPGLALPDSLISVTTMLFDIFGLELYLPLVNGAQVELLSREVIADGESLRRHIESSTATVMQATPATWRMLLAAGWEGSDRLKVLCGGEALPRDLADELAQRCFQLWNMYGPTETTIWSSADRVEGGERVITAGKPIANTQIYVLDEHLQPVPAKVRGEVYIGGDGLARGYLKASDLTAQRFIPDPFSSEGARLYRTGDVGRFLKDGRLEIIGRADNQIKVRGYRIEPAEIESVLVGYEGVREAVVVTSADKSGENRLVAYLIADDDTNLGTKALRAYLREKLPEYMMPSVYMKLDQLPLSANGKLDRKSLPAPKQLRSEFEADWVAPRTPTEETVARIWADLLALEQVSVNDNFFDLGGHSLLATLAMSQIQEAFQAEIEVRELFEFPTVAGLSEAIDKALTAREEHQEIAAAGGRLSLVSIQPEGINPPFFCVHPVGGSVFCYAQLSKHLGLEQPFYGLQARGLEGELEPIEDIETMAAHYILELRGLQPEGPYYLGGWSMGGVVAFEMAQQLLAAGQETAFLALMDARVSGSTGEGIDASDSELLVFFALDLGFPFEDVGSLRSLLVDVAPDEQLDHVLQLAQANNLIAQDAELSTFHRLFKVFRADQRALEAYSPRPYSGDLSIFRAADHQFDTSPDPNLGWKGLALGDINITTVPGNHFTMFREPHVKVLAQEFAAQFDRTKGVKP